MGPVACVTTATATQSQAAVSTQEGLRDEVVAAVAGEEAELSLSVGLGMTLFHPQDFSYRNPVPAYPSLSFLCVANWAASIFLFLSQEKKTGFFYTGEKTQAECLLMGGKAGGGGQRAVLMCSLQLEGSAYMF